MNTDYNININEEVISILKKSISHDLKAIQTAIKILLLKSLPKETPQQQIFNFISDE